MSPPEVWGPAVWCLFHTLAEKINENAYRHLSLQLFSFFVRICKFLPCPECSKDASDFLAKIKPENLKTKLDFKNTFYLFHNVVNLKKRKRPFNYSNMAIYQKYKLLPIIRNFFISYNTKGNMKLLNESFQRQIIIKDFSKWVNLNIRAFINPFISKNPSPVVVTESVVEEEKVIEEVVTEPVIEEQEVVTETVIEEVVTETVIEEQEVVIETVIEEEKVIEEVVTVPTIEEQEVVIESVVEEEKVIEEVVTVPAIEEQEVLPNIEKTVEEFANEFIKEIIIPTEPLEPVTFKNSSEDFVKEDDI